MRARAGDHRRHFSGVWQLSKISTLELMVPKLPVGLVICRATAVGHQSTR
jgi:hypothetical protein